MNFTIRELNTLQLSLLTRRNTIMDLLRVDILSQTTKDNYIEELSDVEGMLERFFPGTMKILNANAA